jgi:hypothetical protein
MRSFARQRSNGLASIWAVQHILAAHHRFYGCTGSKLREISRQSESKESSGGERRMGVNTIIFEPEVSDLIATAFSKSWQFVRTDPELAHNDMDEMRVRLSRHITRLAQSGERDLWRLANSAIGQLRRERRAA